MTAGKKTTCVGRPSRTANTDACSKKDDLRKISMASRLESCKISTPACLETHKISTDASFGTASEAIPSSSLRKETEEKKTEEKSAKAPAAANDAPSGPSGAFGWPARTAGERDLDYYQRLLADAGEPNAVKLLMRLASEKIGVALSHANYGRMTTLTRRHRAAMMVRHILHAAGDHIDKDPMDYLTWLANGKAREEQQYGHPRSPRRATYQPQPSGVAAADPPAGGDPASHAWDGYRHRVVEV